MRLRQSTIDRYRDGDHGYHTSNVIDVVRNEDTDSVWMDILGWILGAVIWLGPIAIQNYIPMWVTYPCAFFIFCLGRVSFKRRTDEAILACHDMAVMQETQEFGDASFVEERTPPYVRRLLARRAGTEREEAVYDRAAVREALRSS